MFAASSTSPPRTGPQNFLCVLFPKLEIPPDTTSHCGHLTPNSSPRRQPVEPKMQSTHSSDESNVTSKGFEKEIMPSEESHTSLDERKSVEEGLSGDETKYPEGYQLLLICVAICLAIFLVALVRREPSPGRTDRIEPKTATSTDQINRTTVS
jgi:hypothetical protein